MSHPISSRSLPDRTPVSRQPRRVAARRIVVLPFLLPLAWWSVLTAETPAGAEEHRERNRPNIVVIMADDLGVECLGCYGSEQYETPNLDRLAASGMRFLNAHSQPICTPSRVQLMTGIYNNRNYLRFGVLDPAAVTFGNLLRGAGYKTCIAGKWQLEGGFDGPRRFGFDRYCLWQLTRRPSRYPNPGFEIDGREVDFKNGQFGPDVASDYVNEFMAENKEGPFLVYYPMIAPHWPFVPTPDHPDWDPTMWRDATGEPGGYRSDKYWDAMVRYTDKMVGKVVDQVDRLGIAENTLILWTGDNGTFQGITSTWKGRQYKGGKGKTIDNGTHVGFIARWPGVIEPGSSSETLVDFSDVLPTLLDVSGTPEPKYADFSGVSLKPAFQGKTRDKQAIYCWYQRDGVREKASEHVRTARYKLYSDGRFFDTQTDRSEKHDLAADGVPESAREVYSVLKQELEKHRMRTVQADPVLSKRRKAHPR
jgi:arylsulfatase A